MRPFLKTPRATLVRRLSLVVVSLGCVLGASKPPPAMAAEKLLGTTRAAHALTRGHNRKVVYEPSTGRWYIFWLEETDGTPVIQPGEGITAQWSKSGKRWTKPVPIGFDEAGSTSFDVVESGGALYALGLEINPLTGFQEYGVRRLDVLPDGSLQPGPLGAAFSYSGPASENHFYGSLLRDAAGGFWIAARVGDNTPGTHAEVIRSTAADAIDAWGPGGCSGEACVNAWADPFPTVTMEQGTIASRLLDLGGFGIGLLTYNKKSGDPATIGQILFTLNPSGGHAGWISPPLRLTEAANQNEGAGPDDPTRLDDRRFSALVDPATGVIHVAYISRDTPDATNANLRYFTLSPPYASLADKSAEQVLVAGETDGVQLAIDSRSQPPRLYAFYIENNAPDYRLKLIWNGGAGWILSAQALLLSGTAGKRHYPQVPASITTDRKIVVLFQEDDSDGIWDIRSVRVKLPR